MVKILLLVVGMAAGAAGATAWLLGESGGEPMEPGAHEGASSGLAGRFDKALAEGRLARAATENRLRHELDVYRTGHDRPPAST